jgi:hypothetical protein
MQLVRTFFSAVRSASPLASTRAIGTTQFISGKPFSTFRGLTKSPYFSDDFSTIRSDEVFTNSTSDTSIKPRFIQARDRLNASLSAALFEHRLDRSSFEAGHKIIAFRSTILSRVHTEIMNKSNDSIKVARAKFGDAALRERIAQNKIYNRFTMHPTEGQNAPTIFRKHSLVETAVLMDEAAQSAKISPELVAEFIKIYSNLDEKIVERLSLSHQIIKGAAEGRAPLKEEFLRATDQLSNVLIDEFVASPIHHTTKMTVDTEREIMLHHLSRCRKDTAKIVADNSEVVSMSDVEFSTWGCDRDGKPHVKPGHGFTLERAGQEVFFKDLITSLNIFKTFLDMKEIDGENFVEQVLKPIQEIAASKPLFFGKEASANEAKITEILEKFAKENPEITASYLFTETQKYVENSGCRVAKNMTSTRQEVDNTDKAFDELASLVGSFEGLDNRAIAAILAENFSSLSKESQTETFFMAESAMLHEKHEHIISQFNCEVASYKKTLKLFQICQHLPEFHEKIPQLREAYKEGLYEELFQVEAIAAAKESFVELSPLAEDKTTIPKLIDFTEAMLADDEITNYIARSGGIVRQTRSNSDGSASLGPQAVTYYYLAADIAIRKMVEDAGFRFEKLAGIGGNDISRMAPLSEEELHTQITIQGGDGQHQNIGRTLRMLLRNPENKSEAAFVDLCEKYPAENIQALVEAFHQLHLESQEGHDVELNGKIVKSGQMTSRGTIPGKAVELLGRLSSRPDSRKGDVQSHAVVANAPDRWHDSVYNSQMRRIGATALLDLSGVSAFLMAPFARPLLEFDGKLLHDFTAIPLMKNTNLCALFALGIADVESFLTANGFAEGVSSKAVVEYAKNYDHFLELRKTDPKAANEFAKTQGFDTPQGIRGGHLSKQVCNLKNVLHSAITPLIYHCSDETKTQLEEVFQASQKGEVIQRYDGLFIKACDIMIEDKAIDLQTRQTLACLKQQVINVTRENGYFDTRKSLIMEAHHASIEASETPVLFEKACEKLAIIYRSSGNPGSPAGRKLEGMRQYFPDAFGTKIPEAEKYARACEVEDLSRC